MERSNKELGRIDRIALAATFAVTTLILVAFGLTAGAATQPTSATAIVVTSTSDPCVPALTSARRR
jgi:Na+/H+-dicarboxylate symporter